MDLAKALSFVPILVISFSLAFAASPQFTGNITYTLYKIANPTADQADAYAKITIAMDSALGYYNTLTTITKKLTVNYDVSVTSADANYNGNMRFGKNRGFMVTCTAMHEIAHTVGIGTTTEWTSKMKNGIYTGVNGTAKLKELAGDAKAVVNGDSKSPFQHFWPYGLNYASEVKSKNDLIYHCLIVNAMMRDLFPKQYPTPILADASGGAGGTPSVSLVSGTTFSYTLPVPCFVSLAVFTLSGQKIFDGGGGGTMKAGTHLMTFDASGVSHGLYLYRFQAGNHVESRTFTITR
jgi:hypothetical protein